MGDLICGACRACCRRTRASDAVRVSAHLGDDEDSYDTQDGRLATLPNGDCVYLGPGGCTIYERRPARCRSFDCRVVAALFDRLEPLARLEAAADMDLKVLAAGRARGTKQSKRL